MKNIKLFCVGALLLASGISQAQDATNRWAVGVGINAIDLYPVGEEDQGLGGYFDEFFNTEHYNIFGGPSRVSVGYYVGDGIVVTGAGSFNQIDQVGDNRVSELTYVSADAGLQYNLSEIWGGNTIVSPFLGIGGSYQWLEDQGFGTFNGTAGFDVKLSQGIALNIQSTYKHTFEDASPKHFQHNVGIKFLFGAKDTDGDGIPDNKDECPEVPGLKQFNGCPDTDLDGIQDSKDDCPEVAGPIENNGCPDTDGDGVLDKDDKCPDVAGPAYNNGCPDPDTDGDGVLDSKDRCPDVQGPASNNGCPTDRDGDGVLDNVDKCPDVAGPASNNGCPIAKPTVEEQKQLNEYAKTILFDTGKTSIKPVSEKVLADIIAILKKYPAADFEIEGHTDSVGTDASNQTLSEGRAASVRTYITSRGIDGDRFTSAGYGESRPVGDNSTAGGRQLNRRVEINLKK